MLGRATGVDLFGIDATLVEVEVDLGGGLPVITTVGLPDPAIREGVDRIRSAIRHSGFQLPQRRVVVNLAPAGLRKQGAALDLPIAMAILAADGQILRPGPEGTVLIGELALDGAVRPVRGGISAAMSAREQGRARIVVPSANAVEAGMVHGIEVVPVASLSEAAGLGSGPIPRARTQVDLLLEQTLEVPEGENLREVRGQALARRALEVAAAGGHNLLMIGPPGAGKTMLARRMPGILPRMTPAEALEVSRVWSAAGLGRGLVTRRPFRAPHHSISCAGLAGGGVRPRPGEVSLALHGVLFLDELPEFRRDALEALRQPMEDGHIQIARAAGTAVLPARFSLVAAMNPCPCGFLGGGNDRCRCSLREIRRYSGKISGPLLDRFDLVVEVPSESVLGAGGERKEESSETVRGRVETARRIQEARSRERRPGRGKCNAGLSVPELERAAPMSPPARSALARAARLYGLSARGCHRILRVARTLADLAGKKRISPEEVMEAVMLRRSGRPTPESS